MINEHPLSEDITKLSSDELDKRYTELMKRYAIARRMNMNEGVMHQLNILLDAIDYEKTRRLYDQGDNSDPVVIDTDPIE
jgi:hypothetical protein